MHYCSAIRWISRAAISGRGAPATNKRRGKTETSFILATIFNLVMNVLYTFVAPVVGILALRFIDLKLLT
jgi:hypothetical protein